MDLKTQITNTVYNFFVSSNDFNGIPLREISSKLNIEYVESINLIKELVTQDILSIQSSTNPHIIGRQHYPIETQLTILNDAKETKVTYETLGGITIQHEHTEFPICLYPSQSYLKDNTDILNYETAVFTKELALGEPQLKPIFFEIEVIDRYFNDPRFHFRFNDFSGEISCKYDEDGHPILRKEDQIFLKTFGLGFDDDGNRLAVVFLRYLKGLTPDHQIFWKSKEIKNGQMLEEYYQTAIKGNWIFSHSIFSAFIREFNCLNNLSNHIFKKPLFRNSFDEENRPKEFTFFFTPTSKNYEAFVLLLDKMLSDNINIDFFQNEIELFEIQKIDNGIVERKPKGSLRLFEEWLTSKYNVHDQNVIKEVFKPLKELRRERQIPAHKISENIYDKKYIKMQQELMRNIYSSIRALRLAFSRHPKSKGFKFPSWLEKGKIKIL